MASSRKTGKYGSLYLHCNAAPALASAVKFADTYNWRWEETVDVEECTRKGEGFKRFLVGAGAARLTCQAHIVGLAALMALGDDALGTSVGPGGSAGDRALPPLIRCAFKLVTVATDIPGATTITPSGMQIIQGFGWITRTSLEASHDALVIDELEIQVDGDWQTLSS